MYVQPFLTGFCEICGYPNCERKSHMAVHDFPYEGTQEELDAIDREMRDLQSQRAELDRLHRVLVQHRIHVLVLMKGNRPPTPEWGHNVPRPPAA